jgi:hypothetical protein
MALRTAEKDEDTLKPDAIEELGHYVLAVLSSVGLVAVVAALAWGWL